MAHTSPTNLDYAVIGMEGVALSRTWMTGDRPEAQATSRN